MYNPFPYSLNNRRFHTFDYHLKTTFGKKVAKISLDGGFTCPNIDGTKGRGGCTYCSGEGSGDFAGDRRLDIVTQFNNVKEKMNTKWKDTFYLPYFQAFTNTYAKVEYLKSVYEPVLTQKDVVGIYIATRADALADEVVEYLKELNERTYLVVELGLQTIFDTTGEKINRCHTYKEFLDGYNKLKKANINIGVHIINGLPLETKEMMLETVKEVARLKPHNIKIHLLHILKGTKIAEQYENNEFETLTLEKYVEIVCDQLELLPPKIIVQRLTGDGSKEDLVAPLWSLKKFVVINEIDKELARRNSYQGKNAEEDLLW
ncbi:MAG: TIGR01212 family radical SAM protein [Clostridia bacterium]